VWGPGHRSAPKGAVLRRAPPHSATIVAECKARRGRDLRDDAVSCRLRPIPTNLRAADNYLIDNKLGPTTPVPRTRIRATSPALARARPSPAIPDILIPYSLFPEVLSRPSP